MHYTLFVYENETDFNSRIDTDKKEAYWDSYTQYGNMLAEAGIMVGGAGLDGPHAATSIRMREGKRHVQDGPYADTKEQLGGYFVIDVPDLDTALEWASKCPGAPGGVVEVRPHLPMPG